MTHCFLHELSPMSDWVNWYRTLPTLELGELRAELVGNQLKATIVDRHIEKRIEKLDNILADRATAHAKDVQELSDENLLLRKQIEDLCRERDKAKAVTRTEELTRRVLSSSRDFDY